ncbi:hypothetical protein [Bacillus sp. EB01]|uniref:hypothetical protein n=1 Tax=Bacillus sp. EB01 TaxID=1347086 RepID=UPI0005C5E6FB|nr:hypothetical protein [Bacillus sp. EB01]
MLTFEQKLAIIESFPELTRKDVSLGRVNFQFEESATEKKNVIYHLHPNGNGYVYAAGQPGYQIEQKGLVNIRDFTEKELRELISKTIALMSGEEEESSEQPNGSLEESWVNKENQKLIVINEDELWNVYFGANLEESFGDYREVLEYMAEEGFSKR